MGRKSTREDKNIYQLAREDAGLTRAAASEIMDFVTESRIEKIESNHMNPSPEDVLAMSIAYKKPGLCKSYCAKHCRIGQEFVPEVEFKSLSQISLEVLASLNTLQREKERLIEITVDGEISDDELEDFFRIRQELAEIGATVDALQLWIQNMLVKGKINKEKLKEIENRKRK
ncbi:MAG: helix-turn-helix transcriptional regulator [Parasporobacterium sp.]|nr:helix-turn-helix transcriptional regulator [Parasporobacterium sp.]